VRLGTVDLRKKVFSSAFSFMITFGIALYQKTL
jgi:hypothetical protein